MLYAVLAIAVVVAAYFGIRYLLLRKSLKEIDRELHEVSDDLAKSRIVKLPSPDRTVEGHLETINGLLEAARREFVNYERSEEQLKKQIGYISHDLRTPLTSIQGYLSLIDTKDLDDEGVEAYETIRRKADSLQRLIVQFHELSQADADAFYADFQVCDVAFMLREALAENYLVLSGRSLEVDLDIPDQPANVLSNPDAVKRIFANLLENAGRYACSRLVVRMERDGGALVISFGNDVEGFDETALEDIFLPFYTGDKARTQESTGLGLAIARKLADSVNAEIGASLDAQGVQGATRMLWFTLSFPDRAVIQGERS